jgi:hypothetical protein
MGSVMKPICVVLAIAGSIMGSSLAPAAEGGAPRVFLLDGVELARTRQQIRDGEKDLAPALAELVKRAEAAMTAGPFSVTKKNAIPPSGDKHDYMSLAPYWWPNPDTADGLPYVRRDGERNPEIYEVRNRLDLGEMASAVEGLALAYYFTGEEKYAQRAALLVRTWFLDPATRMTPHVQYAQAVRGVNDGRPEGLIETRGFTRVVDAIGLLKDSPAWTADDLQATRQWFSEFLQWMQTSEHGRDEAAADNNHGTYYDVQVASYAFFAEQPEVAKRILERAGQRRIAEQVEPDGKQPRELSRTKAWSYSVGNLAGLMALARLGEHVDVDLWRYETDDGRSIRKAIDFLAPFGAGEQPWPYPQINGFSAELFYPVLRMAAAKYPDGEYAKLQAELPPRAPRAAELWLSPIEPINELHLR